MSLEWPLIHSGGGGTFVPLKFLAVDFCILSGALTLMFVPCTVQVCNHPDLFERRNVESPISLSIPPYTVPRLLYYNVMMPSTDRNRSVAWLAIFCMHIICTIQVYNKIYMVRCWVTPRVWRFAYCIVWLLIFNSKIEDCTYMHMHT